MATGIIGDVSVSGKSAASNDTGPVTFGSISYGSGAFGNGGGLTWQVWLIIAAAVVAVLYVVFNRKGK